MQNDRTNRSSRRIGVIMLNTHFPRLPGDVGNPETFACDTLYRRVEVATVDSVISDTGVSSDVSSAIFDAAKDLDKQGVDLIVTSCGFLGELQKDLEKQISTPVISSALLLTPLVRSLFGAKASLGVITFNSSKLKPLHFNGHYDEQIHIQGVERGDELYRVIAGDLESLDYTKAEQDVIAATCSLMKYNPKAIILECTNLSPYIDAVRKNSGVPVFDLIQGIDWLLQAYDGKQ
ncbi:MAG: hypothetical protein V7731_15870 [Amphritea sp.]